ACCLVGGLLRLTGAALLEQPLSLLQSLGRLAGLRTAIAAVGRGLPHRIGGLLKPARRVCQILPLLSLALGLTPQLVELPRGLLGLVGQCPLAGRSTTAALLALLQALGLRGGLELPACEVAQPVGHLVDLRIGALLPGALLELVLVGHAVEFELEEVG